MFVETCLNLKLTLDGAMEGYNLLLLFFTILSYLLTYFQIMCQTKPLDRFWIVHFNM